jgi:hypothetical protein
MRCAGRRNGWVGWYSDIARDQWRRRRAGVRHADCLRDRLMQPGWAIGYIPAALLAALHSRLSTQQRARLRYSGPL